MARGRLAAGAVVLLLCGQYWVAEAVTAAAWRTPYSYSRNFISDLGVTACLPRGPCSPWGAVMNGGLMLSGVLAVLAAVLLAPLVPNRSARRGLVGLAVLHGIGSAVVGLIHSAPGTPGGTPRLHLFGAYAAIIGGNLALLVAGAGVARPWVPSGFRLFSIGVGLAGLGSGLTLIATRAVPPGLAERGAVDTVVLWEVVTGALLARVLIGRRRIRTARPGSANP
jgi:hypothetical membrane protein